MIENKQWVLLSLVLRPCRRIERLLADLISCITSSGLKRDTSRLLMTTINSEQFQEICSGVWRDRATVLRGRGFLSGEIALMRAVYWRLCKTGMAPIGSAENYGALQTVLAYQTGVAHLIEFNGSPQFDGTPFVNHLLEQYQNEVQNVD